DAGRSAYNDPRAKVHQLVDEDEPTLEHLLEDEHRPPRLRRDDDRDRGQVGGERGPRPVVDLRDVAAEVVADLELLAVRDADRAPFDLDSDPESVEGRHDRDEVARLDLLDRDLARGD